MDQEEFDAFEETAAYFAAVIDQLSMALKDQSVARVAYHLGELATFYNLPELGDQVDYLSPRERRRFNTLMRAAQSMLRYEMPGEFML